MATFNILGSCICRDAFGFQSENTHEIRTFRQATSALTWFYFNKKPEFEINTEMLNEISVLSNFQKKCIVDDYNKNVLSRFNTSSDYFITDMTEFASMDIGKQCFSNGVEHFFTFSKWFKKAYDTGLINEYVNNVERVNHLDIINDELIESTMENYVQWLYTHGYKQEQIILIENKRASYYTDGELLFRFNGEKQRNVINCLLDKIYNCFKQKVPNCHVIKIPACILADTRHRWGLTDLHFCEEYYDYLYKSIDLIVGGCPEKELNNLRDYYTNIFMRMREKYTLKSFEYSDGTNIISSENEYLRHCNTYIAPIGIPFYKDKELKQKLGSLSKFFIVTILDINTAVINHKGSQYYIKRELCIKGYLGDSVQLPFNWKTANASTLVITKPDSIIVGHNGCTSCAQTQIINTINDYKSYAGKTLTFSVYARVLEYNNLSQGGSIAIINADNYNKGIFLANTNFDNKEWTRISTTVTLSKDDSFKGLTVCMRAVSGKGEHPSHAKVEFAYPKLEKGTFPTAVY